MKVKIKFCNVKNNYAHTNGLLQTGTDEILAYNEVGELVRGVGIRVNEVRRSYFVCE